MNTCVLSVLCIQAQTYDAAGFAKFVADSRLTSSNSISLDELNLSLDMIAYKTAKRSWLKHLIKLIL